MLHASLQSLVTSVLFYMLFSATTVMVRLTNALGDFGTYVRFEENLLVW